jgi:uncharacterized damage-inducible protein DinB
MNRFLVIASLAAGSLAAQTSNPLSTEVKNAYTTVKGNILKAADKMSDENYAFKPTPEVRTFAEVVLHVVEAQTRTCAAFKGEQKSSTVTAKSSKAEMTAALKQSFADCDAAYDSLTDAAAAEMVKGPRGQRTKLGILYGNATHDVEQYSIMAVYMRLKGVVPPSSEH